MSTQRWMLSVLLILALLAPGAVAPVPAHAGGVVTVCDEAHLLAALAGGGTVTFACSGVITLTNTITIAVDTTIDGSGQEVTISGNNAVRVFYVNAGVTFNLKRLTVADGWADDGGGVYNAGTLAVDHCAFTGNRAHSTGDVGSGGAIYNAGTLTLNDSVFTGNSASGVEFGVGGAIRSSGTLIVRHGAFTGNTSQDYGGAISSSNLMVSNSTFTGNSAMIGGALHASGLVENCTFEGNSGSEGGAINGGGWLTVNNSTFVNNSSGLGGGIGYFGSAYSVLTVRNSTFSGNTSTGEGGGLFVAGKATVAGSTFVGNSAAGAGGGMAIWGELTSISNSTIVGNSANHGGGIHKFGFGALTVSNSTLAGNSADYGGGIYTAGGTLTLKNTVVAHSLAGGNCSGAITDGGGNVSYPDATCPGVNADPLLGPLQDNGGPTWTMALGEGSAAIDAGIDLTCVTAPVSSLDQRGVMRPQGPHCDSGAVEESQEATVTLVEVCDEAHLRAALAGGGTVMFTCSGVITLADEIALEANVTIDGAGQDVTISGNNVVRVLRVDPGWTLNLLNLAIVHGAAALGGAIYVDTGVVNVNDCTFSGHSGGAIVNDFGTLTVSQSTFSGNGGRSIRNNGNEARLTVSDSLFSGNNGGGIFNGGPGFGGTAIVTHSIFVGNMTTGAGGGIYNDWASSLDVSDSTFSDNSAQYGGGIYSYGDTIVRNSTFAGNSAQYGGAIYSIDSSLTVINSTFSDNSAVSQGGGIYGLSGGIAISNSTFSGNHATDGGAIYNQGGLTVINSTFSGNHATSVSVIYNPDGGATLKNTIVANNPGALSCAGVVTDGGGNLSFPDTTCPGINADPTLGPLQDNGGPTWTMALGHGSAAIDAGDDAICAAPPVNNLDQRGVARPQGSHCDIGAVEQIIDPTAVTVSTMSAGNTPHAIPPMLIFGVLLAVLAAIAKAAPTRTPTATGQPAHQRQHLSCTTTSSR